MRVSYRKWMLVMLMVAFLAGLAACQTPAGRSVGAVVDDATITSKIKTKMITDDRLSAFGIDVDTFKGEVTLTGGVNTPAEKQQATEVARSVKGVTHVNNFLKVKH